MRGPTNGVEMNGMMEASSTKRLRPGMSVRTNRPCQECTHPDGEEAQTLIDD